MNWVSIETTALDVARSATGLAVNSLCQSTLLIVAGIGFAWLLRWRGSAVQSAIYRTTLIAVLMCPFATWILSRVGMSGWSIEMPVAWQLVAQPELANSQASPEQDPAGADDDSSSLALAPPYAVGVPAPVDMASDAARAARPSDGSDSNGNSVRNSGAAAGVVAIAAASASETIGDARAVGIRQFGWIAMGACVVWFVVATALIARLALAWRQLAGTRGQALAADDETVRMCREVAALVGVRPPDVRLSPFLPSPCLAGLRQPVVLLPDAEIQLSLHDVLIHELAHLARHDCQWNLARRLATSLFFFQPLLWRLSRQMETAAEEVCDDCVVLLGASRRAYAHQLVDMAELSTARLAAAGVGIVSFRSMLGRRVARIMDTSRSLSTRVGGVLFAIVLIAGLTSTLLVGLVGIGPNHATAAGADPSADDRGVKQVGDANPDHPPNNDIVTVRGHVVDQDSKPVAGATVIADWVFTGDERSHPRSQPSELIEHVVVAQTQSGQDGTFELAFSKKSPHKNRISESWHIAAFADGFAPAWKRDVQLVDDSSPELRLIRAEPVQGRIVDLEGKPISGVRVKVHELRPAKSEQALQDWIAKAKELSPAKSVNDYLSIMSSTTDSDGSYPAAFPALWNDGRLANGSPALPVDAQTDADGRFQFDSLGDNRLATIEIESPVLAKCYLPVITRQLDTLSARPPGFVGIRNGTYYGRKFEFVAEPTQPIEGTVTDADTGQPLADFQVRLGQFAENLYSQEDFLATRTDEQGKYRLVGAPQGGGHRIDVEPTPDQPYFVTQKKLESTTSSFEPIRCDFALKRGKWIEGKVAEDDTGKPIVDATVDFLPLRSNEFAKAYSNYRPEITGSAPSDRYRTDKDGRFRVLAIPGPGILAAIAQNDDRQLYTSLSADDLPRRLIGEAGHLNAYHPWVVTGYHALREVDLPESSNESKSFDLQFKRGLTRQIKLIDNDGQPVTGVRVLGRAFPSTYLEEPLHESTMELIGLRPNGERIVVLIQPEKRIGRALRVSTGDDLTVELQPCAIVHGRFIDDEGEPVRDAAVNVTIDAPDNWLRGLIGSATDQEGRFEALLPPGMTCRVWHYQLEKGPNFSAECQATPGAAFELGDLVNGIKLTTEQTAKLLGTTTTNDAGPRAENQSEEVPYNVPASGTNSANKIQSTREPNASAIPKAIPAGDAKTGAAQSAEATSPEQITGDVIGPDGKPVAGAKLYWITWSLRGVNPDAQQIATAGADGGFRFVPPKDDATFVSVDGIAMRHIVVVADGYGMAYVPAQAPRRNVLDLISQAMSGRTIQLPADAAIRGHVVDIEGQPVAGARVSIRKLVDKHDQFAGAARDIQVRDPSVDAEWLVPIHNLVDQFFPRQLPTVAPTATTGADGHFELRGVGPDRLVQLLITGEGVESTLLLARTSAGPSITLTPDRHGDEKPMTLYGPDFDYAIGPSKPVEGRVVDLDAGSPISDAVVRAYAVHGDRLSSSRERQQFATRTDSNGNYQIFGLPVGDGNKLVAFTTGDVPYVPVGHSIDTSTGDTRVQQDFRLKRGVWAVGRAYDAQSKEPLTGELSYYWFRTPELEQAIPGLREAYVDENYFTNANGEFRVPVLAARGILAFRYAPLNSMDAARYPRGAGAAAIAGGQGNAEFTKFPTYPFYLMASNYQMVVEMNPAEGQEKLEVDMPLSAGGRLTVRVVDESQQPLTSIEFYGRALNWGWGSGNGTACEIVAIQPGEQRKLFFFDRGRNLAGATTVDEHTKDGLTVQLRPAGSIRGRLVDAEGQPINDATVTADYDKLSANPDAAIWPAHPELRSSADQIPVDSEGRFRLDGIAPGWKYSAWAVAPRKMQGQMTSRGIGRVFDDLTLQPGEDRDLGDIRVVEKGETPAPATGKSSKTSAAGEKTKAALSASSRAHVHGRVVGPDGMPASGAHVAVFAFKQQESRGGDLAGSRNEVLAEIATDADGSYSLDLIGLSSKTHFSATLVGLSDGAGLAWRRLDPDASETEASLSLAAESPIRGRLVDIEGQSAAKVQMTIASLVTTSPAGESRDGVYFGDFESPSTIAWPQSITSDADGRFVIHNVAASQGVFLNVIGTDRFAPQQLALNTGLPEQRGERDGTYRPQVVKNLQLGEEAVLPLAPAQMIEGVVRYEDTGEPAPNARLTVWASQQEHGSMTSVGGRAGDTGRYRISPFPGIRFGVTAYPPDGTPYLIREAEPINWNDNAAPKQVDVSLPRGVLVRGNIVEKESGKPIAGATVQYVPERANNSHAIKGVIVGWEGIELADVNGHFQIAVLPGPGRLLIHGPGHEFVVQETSSDELSSGRPGGERLYANAIERINPEPSPGSVDVTIQLERGGHVKGRIVDEQGDPIAKALVISQLNIHPTILEWRGDSVEATGGHFELSGLSPEKTYQVYFLEPKRRLGAVATLKVGDEDPLIVLKRCGQATARYVDTDGRPAAGLQPSLKMVATPLSRWFDFKMLELRKLNAENELVANIDRKNYWTGPSTDEDGRITFPALIPNATYQLDRWEDASYVAKEFAVASRETRDLGEFVVHQTK
jgi:beta-lactamase regulating signal transducer with metallopeptidase domain/protocatechuate 3,4-dioxygenase beta subunit/5-hydroxyisourate hydrolase-like protein (transthyretin family)